MGMFKPASRKKARLRMAFDGPSGSGKTFTALRSAFAIVKHIRETEQREARVAVINTESGAVEKYLGMAPDEIPWEFDICELTDYAPTSYTQAILAAGQEKYDVVIVDSLSHAWAGEGGALDLKDRKAVHTHNSFTAWKDVTPMHNRMVDSMLRSPCHVIVTMRSKMEYILEEHTNAQGKTVMAPRKVGMQPIQRAGMEYEFDIVADLDHTHTLSVGKTRCSAVDGHVVVKPSGEWMAPVIQWLYDGVDVDPSHYAVTEADLAAHEAAKKKVEAAARADEPKKDFKEVAREKAAARERAEKAAGNGEQTSPAATTNLAPFDASDANGVYSESVAKAACSRVQVESVRTLLGEIAEFEPDISIRVKQLVQRFGKEKVKELTRAEAEDLILRLSKKRADHRFAQPAPKKAAAKN